MNKKLIIKTLVISIILIFTISLQSFAESSFRLKFQDGTKLKAGETIEIPIIVDNINIEGVEKKIFTFSGKVEFDEETFELVPYEIDGEEKFFKPSEELADYGLLVRYDEETKQIVTSLEKEYIDKVNAGTVEENNMKFLNNLLVIGTMKFKAKEDAKVGSYQVYISNVEANNSEFTIKPTMEFTQINIYEEAKEEQEKPEAGKDQSKYETNNNKNGSKKAILTIEVSEDGKSITLAPDEVNGAIVKTIKYKNTELAKENGVFVFESEPNNVYEFLVYGLNEGYLGNEFVSTKIKAKEDNSKKEENKGDKKEEKSPQTGDIVYLAGAMLIIAVIGLGICLTKKNK